jgi:hypothetical protein
MELQKDQIIYYKRKPRIFFSGHKTKLLYVDIFVKQVLYRRLTQDEAFVLVFTALPEDPRFSFVICTISASLSSSRPLITTPEITAIIMMENMIGYCDTPCYCCPRNL